ncbi:protein kinase [Streptomyces sp. NPDC002734]|uniref:serine/threonine-protein kinase n=1 Tax=Streptomyces sp. NPDC002734 TaxID=3154426 RepID=UPI00332BBE5F
MQPLDTDQDPAVLGPFELLARLGAGGMGVAYLARRLPLDGLTEEEAAAYHLVEPDEGADTGEARLTVIKMIQPDLLDLPEARERFRTEIDAVRAVVSDRVPALVAAVPDAAEPWFAMDYVAGPTLHQLVKETGILPLGPCAALGLALVDALRAIHGTGLLHRDLKPGNVVLGPNGPVVLDFGLAVLTDRPSSQALTATGTTKGTHAYMPFEQLQDTKHVKEPADVYSLGATLFFALTRRPPFPLVPLMASPSFDGVDAVFVPLLAQILVATPSQRPDLDSIETSLLSLLAAADLTPQQAADQLLARVVASGLIPELPEEILAETVDPKVQEEARRAVGEAADELADAEAEFFGIDTDNVEWAEEVAAGGQHAEPDATPPSDVRDAAQPEPMPPQGASPSAGSDVEGEGADWPGSGAEPVPPPTSYRLPPPRRSAPTGPSRVKAPPRAPALKIAEQLRRAYARNGRL